MNLNFSCLLIYGSVDELNYEHNFYLAAQLVPSDVKDIPVDAVIGILTTCPKLSHTISSCFTSHGIMLMNKKAEEERMRKEEEEKKMKEFQQVIYKSEQLLKKHQSPRIVKQRENDSPTKISMEEIKSLMEDNDEETEAGESHVESKPDGNADARSTNGMTKPIEVTSLPVTPPKDDTADSDITTADSTSDSHPTNVDVTLDPDHATVDVTCDPDPATVDMPEIKVTRLDFPTTQPEDAAVLAPISITADAPTIKIIQLEGLDLAKAIGSRALDGWTMVPPDRKVCCQNCNKRDALMSKFGKIDCVRCSLTL